MALRPNHISYRECGDLFGVKGFIPRETTVLWRYLARTIDEPPRWIGEHGPERSSA